MKAGPKASVDDSPLPWRPRSTGSARFGKFCAPEGICGMLPRSSAFAARHSAPDTAAYARAAAACWYVHSDPEPVRRYQGQGSTAETRIGAHFGVDVTWH